MSVHEMKKFQLPLLSAYQYDLLKESLSNAEGYYLDEETHDSKQYKKISMLTAYRTRNTKPVYK